MSSAVDAYLERKARLVRFADSRWLASGMTEWPSVRQAAKSLRLTQPEVCELVEDSDELGLEYWNVDWKVPDGDWMIYSSSPAVEAAWGAYWEGR